MDTPEKQWFVMRDLRRRNARSLAVHDLAKAGLEVFTPMTQMVMNIGGRAVRREVPVIQDLLFVHEAKPVLDPFVSRMPALQYRYLLGKSASEPMTVRPSDMDRFIFAVSNAESVEFYSPGELTEAMCGKRVRVVGGLFDGYDGRLLSIRGKRKRRLIVELPGLMAAAVEVEPEFIRLV